MDVDEGNHRTVRRPRFCPLRKELRMNKNIWITFLAILTILGFSWGFYESKQTEIAARQIENDASRSFYELMDSADELSVLTTKAVIANDNDNRADLYAQISREAYVAQENLSMLPIYNGTLSRTERFLNQIGDFSASLVAKAARNEQPTAKEAETIKSLQAEVTEMANALHKMDDSDENAFSYKAIRETNKSVRKNDLSHAGFALTSLSDITKTVSKSPSLIYDGPYSDHLENKGPVNLNGEVISWKTAKEKAAALFGEGNRYEAYEKSSGAAGISVYTIALKHGKKDKTPFGYADFSVHGGYLVQYTSETEKGEALISPEKAIESATAFLRKAGYDNLKAGYHITKGNVLTANLTHMIDDVIVYPDMIKVSVDLTSGKIVGIDAKNYLEFHKERTLPTMILTVEAAKEHLPAGSTPITVNRAVIPKKNETEVFCYEFHLRENDTDYLIYINAETGKEENILVVTDNKNGTFTM